jgi:hypothetical protein
VVKVRKLRTPKLQLLTANLFTRISYKINFRDISLPVLNSNYLHFYLFNSFTVRTIFQYDEVEEGVDSDGTIILLFDASSDEAVVATKEDER